MSLARGALQGRREPRAAGRGRSDLSGLAQDGAGVVVARAGEAPEGLERQDTRCGARVVRCEAQRLDHPRVPARARERVQRVHQLPRARATQTRAHRGARPRCPWEQLPVGVGARRAPRR